MKAARSSSKAAAPKPRAKTLPRTRPPVAAAESSTPKRSSKPPAEVSEGRELRLLLEALVALLSTWQPRAQHHAARCVLEALDGLLSVVEHYLSAPLGARQLTPYRGTTEARGMIAGLNSNDVQPAAPPPAAPKTQEQLRAHADAVTDMAVGRIESLAERLEEAGKAYPHATSRAAQLAAGLRALLAPPAPTLAPTQKRLVVDLFETLKHHGQLVDALAVARDEAADLRRKWIDGADREEIRRALNEVDSCIEHARHLTWKVGDGLNMSAGHITGDASPDGALGQAIELAMLLRAADWHGQSDEDVHVLRAHCAWNSAE